MTELPTPLTPANCDLTDFAFMPLDVNRLRRSKMWLVSKRMPELAFYALNLWTASWHEIPAASIEDDDDVLADFAMCDPKRWKKIKAEALRGWVKCADGRLYHPVVAEKAIESWFKKVQYAWGKECDRIRKSNKKREADGQPSLQFPEEPTLKSLFVPRNETNFPPEIKIIPPEIQTPSDSQSTPSEKIPTENALKGEGQGQGEGQGELLKPSVPVGTGGTPPKSPEELTKDELWAVGKSLLYESGMPKGQCGTFVGVLVRDYGTDIVIDAVRTAVAERPADPASFLKACCQRRKQERPNRQESLEQKNRKIAEQLAGAAA